MDRAVNALNHGLVDGQTMRVVGVALQFGGPTFQGNLSPPEIMDRIRDPEKFGIKQWDLEALKARLATDGCKIWMRRHIASK
jgi:hypothetical protein